MMAALPLSSAPPPLWLPPRRIGGWRQSASAPARPSTLNCSWKTLAQPIDHFGAQRGSFRQRYCLYDRWWREPDGPILLYTGNESPVEEYVNHTGLMWELGPSLSALLVFAEHRWPDARHAPLLPPLPRAWSAPLAVESQV